MVAIERKMEFGSNATFKREPVEAVSYHKCDSTTAGPEGRVT